MLPWERCHLSLSEYVSLTNEIETLMEGLPAAGPGTRSYRVNKGESAFEKSMIDCFTAA